MDKIKILHLFASWEKGGAEMWLLKFLEKFREDPRFDNHIGALFEQGRLKEQFEKLGIPVIDFNMRHSLDLAGRHQLRKCLLSEKYDIVHSHLLKTDLMLQMASVGLNSILVSTKHNNFYNAGFINRYVENLINRRFDHIFCVSEDVRKAVTRFGTVPVDKTEVVYPVHISQSDIPGDRQLFKGKKITVGTLGRLHPVKGLKYLLRAWPKVAKKAPGSRLIIAGPDVANHKSMLLKEITTGNKQLNISWPGEVEDIINYFSKIDIFCIPSVSEGFPLSVIEAMAAGKPVVGSDVGGITEQVVNMENGILFPVGDTDALAEALLFFAKDKSEIDKMGQKSLDFVIKKFNMEDSIEKIKNTYLNLCSGEKHSE